MAITTTLDSPPVEFVGQNRVVRGTFTFDSSYPTGGEAVSLVNLGLSYLIDLELSGDDGIVLRWDRSQTAPLILAYWTSNTTDGEALVEVTATTDLSALITRFVATGK